MIRSEPSYGIQRNSTVIAVFTAHVINKHIGKIHIIIGAQINDSILNTIMIILYVNRIRSLK